MQCINDNVNDYFSSRSPTSEDVSVNVAYAILHAQFLQDLKQVLKFVIDLASDLTAQVIACWDILKMGEGETLAADRIGISIGRNVSSY